MDKRKAERHDAEIRAWIKSQETAWEAARKDYSTIAVSLGYELPEKRLTPREKNHLKKRADKIIRAELLKLLKGQEISADMRAFAKIWLLQEERGRGRPANKIKKGLIIQAVSDEERKYFGLRRPKHKQILGAVGDTVGLGMDRMKQLAPDPVTAINRAVKRLARKRKRK